MSTDAARNRTASAQIVVSAILAITLAFGLAPLPAYGSQDLQAQGAVQLNTESASKASAQAKMRKLYKQVLAKGKNGTSWFTYLKSKGGSYYSVLGYTLFDIDRNGTPELLVNAGDGTTAFTSWFAFTVKSGKLKYLGKFGDGQTSLFRVGKKLYSWRAHMGGMQIHRLGISKGKVRQKLVISDTDANVNNPFPKWAKFRRTHNVKFITASKSYDYSAINKAKIAN